MAPGSSGAMRRVLGALCLIGIALLVSGLFPPWIIRINYLSNAHCPHSPTCPPPLIDTRSLWQGVIGDPPTPASLSWWLNASMILGPLLLIVALQLAIGLAALSGHRSAVLITVGMGWGLVILPLYLLMSRIYYCLFAMVCGATGPWATPGDRILAPGFWLLLGGILIAIGCDLALLRQRNGRERRTQLERASA
ncbi:MAG TPA: hypothetical protein VF808_00725 [Ktedonobacterales bacterium]